VVLLTPKDGRKSLKEITSRMFEGYDATLKKQKNKWQVTEKYGTK